MKKKSFLIIILVLTVFVFASCQDSNQDNNDTQPVAQEENSEEMLKLTLEELSEYDGKDGNKAYVAVDGIIYDVTGLNSWTNGMHNGAAAGKDLTDEIKNDSPHGTSKLSKAEKVGKLIE